MQFVDCKTGPTISEELFDDLPSDRLVKKVLSDTRQPLESSTLSDRTLDSCRQYLEESIRNILEEMKDVFTLLETYIPESKIQVISQYWQLEDGKPKLSPAETVVVKSLLLMCSGNNLILMQNNLLNTLQNEDVSTIPIDQIVALINTFQK